LCVLIIFEMGSCFYAQAGLDCIPPIYAYHIVGMTGNCATMLCFLLIEMQSYKLFARASLEPILPISTSQVVRITCLSHDIWLRNNYVEIKFSSRQSTHLNCMIQCVFI
jgi:hypothetical protein